jgi:TonB family protein
MRYLRDLLCTTTAVLFLTAGPGLLFAQSDYIKVSVEPKLLEKPPLKFPEEALGASVSGRIWVKALVGLDGVPVRTEVLKREPEMAYMFDETARRWLMTCRFAPARDTLGRPVKVWLTIPINFKVEDFLPPVPTSLATPMYPEDALAMGMEGWVGVAVYVDAMGNAQNSKSVVVAREPPYTTVFDDAAKAAARTSQYNPATYSGRNTDGWCFVKIIFRIDRP